MSVKVISRYINHEVNFKSNPLYILAIDSILDLGYNIHTIS